MAADDIARLAPLFAWFASYLLCSTVLLGGVWLFLRMRPSCGPSLREGLWKGAVVLAVLTATVPSLVDVPQPFGKVAFQLGTEWIQPAGPHIEQGAGIERESGPQPVAARASAELPEGEWILEDVGFEELISAGPISSSVQHVAAASARKSISGGTPEDRTASIWVSRARVGVMTLPLAVVLLATVWGWGRCLRQSLVFRRRLSGCGEVHDGRARRLLDELCANLPGARRVRLLFAEDDAEPAAFGIRQWTIVLPQRAELDLAEDELRALLAHELAHLVRGDIAWLGAWRIVCSCGAFQPLNHLARREWQRAAEWLCDNWAVQQTGSRLALARCLAEVAGWRLGQAACAPSLAATGSNRGLSSRIERLLEETPLVDAEETSRSQRSLVTTLGAASVVLICCAPRISLSTPPPAPTENHRLTNVGLNHAVPPQGGREILVVADAAVETASPPPDAGHAGDFAQLDREWSALAAELAELEPLLRRQNLSAEGLAVAESLVRQIAALRLRHAELARIRERVAQQRPVNLSTTP